MKRIAQGLVCVVAMMATACASAADPGGVTRIIVPFTAGGGVDSLARVLSRSLQQQLGSPVIVENKPGAGGNIATSYVAAAAPDGKTLLLTTNGLVINPIVYSNTDYNARTSLAPIGMLAESPVVFVTPSNSPFHTLSDVIKLARSGAGRFSYASCGAGNIHHFAGELLKSMANIDIVHVPYKGCSQAANDVISGQTDLGVISLTSIAPYLGNRLRALAVTSAKRSELLPAVPTVAEASGMDGYALTGWYAMLAPRNTPKQVVDSLSRMLNAALKDREVRANLASSHMQPIGNTPVELAKFIDEDDGRMREIARKSGIRLD